MAIYTASALKICISSTTAIPLLGIHLVIQYRYIQRWMPEDVSQGIVLNIQYTSLENCFLRNLANEKFYLEHATKKSSYK